MVEDHPSNVTSRMKRMEPHVEPHVEPHWIAYAEYG